MKYNPSNKKKVNSVEAPCKKTMYNSPEEAQDIVDYIRENRGGPELHIYICEICGFWHLTSKTK
jgi:rubrerythrin